VAGEFDISQTTRLLHDVLIHAFDNGRRR
jgi:hypothetical protein